MYKLMPIILPVKRIKKEKVSIAKKKGEEKKIVNLKKIKSVHEIIQAAHEGKIEMGLYTAKESDEKLVSICVIE